MHRYSGGNTSALLAKVSSQLRGGPSHSANTAADDEDIGVINPHHPNKQD